jgi:hypothetical protein
MVDSDVRWKAPCSRDIEFSEIFSGKLKLSDLVAVGFDKPDIVFGIDTDPGG